MEGRPFSHAHDAPEPVPNQQRSNFGFIGSDAYEYYEPPASTSERQRSPVPEYSQFETHTSTQISATSPPPPSSTLGRSPQFSEGSFSKTHPHSPYAQYSEIHSPDPEAVYDGGEKEAVYLDDPHSKVPSYQSSPMPGIQHQNSSDRPQVWSDAHHREDQRRKKPFYARWIFILGILALLIIIAVAIALGVVFGKKKSHDSGASGGTSGGSSGSGGHSNSTDNPNVDINTSVGGYINNAYYSKSGAWNGSGIAIAAANTALNEAIYAFYQDASGVIEYTLMNAQTQWSQIGQVNAGSYKALNGTPLSTVQLALGAELVWHLFYIDENYYVRQRIITNTSTTSITPVWTDGPLSSMNLKAWASNTIGLQACYYGNYYGQWSYNATQASAGIHIWYASGATEFQQYSWTNGTDKWVFDQQWNALSGNGGVGCQTWDTGMTEYVWFVDTNNEIAMFWKDNNHTGVSTPSHPVNVWTSVDIKISNVQQDSSLGYTNYMIYQATDTTIRGANVTWGAENTTIAEGTQNGLDTFTLQSGGVDVHAIRGSHLSITAVRTVSLGASLLIFLQQIGTDMQMYTRDAFNSGGLWQAAAQNPVSAT